LAFEKERLQLAMDAGRMGAWEWEIASGRVIWSPSLEQIHGLEPGTFPGTFEAYQADIHPEDRERVLGAIRRCLETGEDHEMEYRIVTPAGETRWVAARGRILADDRGNPVRMLGICRDVTAARRDAGRRDFLISAVQTLAASLDYETALRRVAALAVPHVADWCGVDLLDGDTLRPLVVAHADPEKVALAETYLRAYPPGPDDAHGVWAVVRSGRPEMMSEIGDAQLRAGAGDARQAERLRALDPHSYLIVPIHAEGHVVGVFSLASTDSKRSLGSLDLELAETLAQAAGVAIEKARLYRQAERAIESRDDLMAMVSHDLRNALSVLVLRATALKGRLGEPPAAEPGVLRDAEGLQNAARRMDRMVLDLVDGVAIDGGGLHLDIRNEGVAELLADALAGLQALADRSGQRLDVEVVGLEGLQVACDAERVTQILENLVANAAKFGPEGGRIGIRVVRSPEGAEIMVVDQGPGVPAEARQRIFERYAKSEDARGGLGLGLYIADAIVRAHGGRIWVEDAPGGGAAFRFTLPVANR
jgi:PAS domain S-box-containing protein